MPELQPAGAQILETEGPGLDSRITPIVPGVAETAKEVLAAVEQNLRETAVKQSLQETLLIGNHRIDFLRSEDMTPEMIDSVADYFRYIFITDFPEYALCQPCDVRMGAREALKLSDGVHLSLEEADSIACMPSCKSCGNEMELFHDPGKTRAKIHEKLDKNAYVTLIRPEGSNVIEGFNFSYEATLREAFQKEWQYRFAYAKKQDPRFTRDEERFLKTAVESVKESMKGEDGILPEITPDSKAMCWNCTVIGPNARNAGLLPPMLAHFFGSLPQDKVKSMVAMGETIAGTKYNKILSAAGCRSNEGVLGGDYILMTVPLQKVTEYFSAVRAKKRR